jgi:hypothetical protein
LFSTLAALEVRGEETQTDAPGGKMSLWKLSARRGTRKLIGCTMLPVTLYARAIWLADEHRQLLPSSRRLIPSIPPLRASGHAHSPRSHPR